MSGPLINAREALLHLYARPGHLVSLILVRGLAQDLGPDNNAATEADRRRNFASVAGLSSTGRVVVAQKSGHHVRLDQTL